MTVIFAKLFCTFIALAFACAFASDLEGPTSRLGRIGLKAMVLSGAGALASAVAWAWSL